MKKILLGLILLLACVSVKAINYIITVFNDCDSLVNIVGDDGKKFGPLDIKHSRDLWVNPANLPIKVAEQNGCKVLEKVPNLRGDVFVIGKQLVSVPPVDVEEVSVDIE